MTNAIFVLCGNCRTFIDCVDSIYNHVISKLFSQDVNIYVYLYLKLTDPGKKGQHGWDFEYPNVHYETLINKINLIKSIYPRLNVDFKILPDNEISDRDLFSQVKKRHLYNGFYSENKKLIRGMHVHYNFECCGKYILEKESSNGILFDYIIYVRPDLFFYESCHDISLYNKSVITAMNGTDDRFAIIPRNNLHSFFFERMNVYRNNITKFYSHAEIVYFDTIKHEDKYMGQYYIKRN